jgi:mRNA interferase HigB
MLLLGKLRLEIFVRQHEEARVPLAAWQLEAEESAWTGPEEVQARYAAAVVESNRILFSIKKLYKLDVKAEFKNGVLLVQRVWTEVTKPAAQKTARSKA